MTKKKKRRKIAWAKGGLLAECGETWQPRPGEVVTYQDAKGESYEEPARGPHCCVKDRRHVTDPTDDDHQCCCGNSSWNP